MKYLVDSSIWLEVALEQRDAEQAARFLQHAPIQDLSISLFALHSIGVVLVRKHRPQVYIEFLQETIIAGGLTVFSLDAPALRDVIEAARRYSLDFDDAYQYVIAEQYNLTIVSFDAHFDRTPRGRKTPAQLTRPDAENAPDVP